MPGRYDFIGGGYGLPPGSYYGPPRGYQSGPAIPGNLYGNQPSMSGWDRYLPLIGLGLSGLGTILGATSANRTNAQNLAAQQAAREQLLALIMPMLNPEPGAAETQLLDFLNGGGGSETDNVGQDALLQMLRADPVNTDELFASWSPIESRALSEALAGAWAGASGLGERFGSAQIREEGRIRGEAAENAAARRAQTSVQLAESNADRRSQIAQFLAELGTREDATQLGAIGQLLGAEQGRNALNLQLLALLAGVPVPQAAGSATPGAIGDIGQLLIMLPFLQDIMRQ